MNITILIHLYKRADISVVHALVTPNDSEAFKDPRSFWPNVYPAARVRYQPCHC